MFSLIFYYYNVLNASPSLQQEAPRKTQETTVSPNKYHNKVALKKQHLKISSCWCSRVLGSWQRG